jgi:integrase
MQPAPEKRLLEFLRTVYRENSNGNLFVNRNGNPYSIGKVKEYGLWPALEKLKIVRAGLHAFRHAAATGLLEQGAPLTVVQRRLRHRDARTTLQKYGHVEGERRSGPLRRWPRTSYVMLQLNWSQVLKWSQALRK